MKRIIPALAALSMLLAACGSPPAAPAPTSAPTTPVVAAPTDMQAPTTPPTSAPTQAPANTATLVPPTEAPAPTEAPTQAPPPTLAPTDTAQAVTAVKPIFIDFFAVW